MVSLLKRIGRKELQFAVGVAFSLFYIYQAIFGIVSPAVNRSAFIMFGVVLVMLNKPAKGYLAILDILIILFVVFGTFYFIFNFDYYARNYGLPLRVPDIVIGTIMMIIVTEAVRRQLGWTIAILAIVFVAYLVLGRYTPSLIRHSGFSWDEIISTMYASTDGIYGSVTYVLATYMLLFLIFGAFLKAGGATNFYLKLANALMGHRMGGPAKAAVTSSFIMGMITGSASANVAVTGQVTIPMMKKSGYAPHVAGGTEAAASLGGTILPPIMGASAFIMVALTGIPYLSIIKFAFIPAAIYFVTVFLHSHFYAVKKGLHGSPKDQLPSVVQTLKEGFHFIGPILVLIFFLVRGATLQRVGLYSIVSVILLSYVRKDTRMSVKKIFQALADGARTALPIVAVAGPVGLISAAVLLPGMGLRVSGMILGLTGGSILLTILFIFIIGYILGMGLSIIPAYIMLATLGAPALINLGIPVAAAHLMVLWYGQLSTITPPVCLGSYVAAGIAEASFWKTGMQGVMRAAAIFYLPVVFVYQPELLLIGEVGSIIFVIVTTFVGAFCVVAAFEGYFLGKLWIWIRGLMFAAAILVILNSLLLKGIGLAVLLVVVAIQLIRKRIDATRDVQPSSS
jgi:TRAP transporter 4TM/12TM fusion protein